MTAWLYAKKDDVTIIRPVVVMDDYIEPMTMYYLGGGVPTYDVPETMHFRMIYDTETYRELQTGIWDVCISILGGMVHRFSFKAYVCKCSVVSGEIGKPLCMEWNIAQTTPFTIELFRVKRRIIVSAQKRDVRYESKQKL